MLMRRLVGGRRSNSPILPAISAFYKQPSPPPAASLRRAYSGDAGPPPPSSPAEKHHPHHPQSPPQELLDLLTSADGSLDDLEAALARLPINPTPSLLTQTLASFTPSTAASRRLLRFFSWCRRNSQEPFTDEAFNLTIQSLTSTNDVTAMAILISDLHTENRRMDPPTFALTAQTLVRSNRPDDALRLFRHCLRRKDCSRSSITLSIIHALCEKGHALEAERIFRRSKDKIFVASSPGVVHRLLLHGWCVHRNAGQARRVINEMNALSIPVGVVSYHDFLQCVCKRNLKFNPSALVQEATDVMTEMRRSGATPTAISFNILLSCLCRTRRVKEACRVLDAMAGGEAECSPDWHSYYLVAKVLYLMGRFGRGHEVVEEMVGAAVPAAAGFYHGLVGVLCGMEEIGHALKVFDFMRKWCKEEDTGPTYELLIEKVCRNGKFEMGRRLWDESVDRGVVIRCSSDLLDPSKVQVFKIVKKRKKMKSKMDECNEIVQGRKYVDACKKGKIRRKKVGVCEKGKIRRKKNTCHITGA